MAENSVRTPTRLLLLICVLSAAIRFAYLPYATMTSNDRVYRTWIAWRWLSDPELITHGLWGPLHTYLIALAMTVYPDPVLSPVVMQIVFETATPLLVYLFVRNEQGSSRAAVAASLAYALYPLAILNTLGLMTQPIFGFWVILGMLFLSYCRQPDGSWRHAALAGIAITFAGMIRYEGWMLIPFLAAVLWRKPRYLLVFLVFAMIHPVFWMIGNGLAYGEPLFGMSGATRWELESMDRASIPLPDKVRMAINFVYQMLRWLTPPLAVVAGAGCIIAVIRKQRTVIWLIPLIGLLCLYLGAIIRGSLVPKFEYTQPVGFMLMMYSAVTLRSLAIDQWSRKTMAMTLTAFGLTMFAFSYPPVLFPHALKLSVDPLPSFQNQEKIQEVIVPAVSEHLESEDDGYITDFYGFVQSLYPAHALRLHPDRVFATTGAPLLAPESRYDKLEALLVAHPKGLLLLHTGSRFAESLGYPNDQEFRVRDKRLHVERVWSTPWPGFDDPRLRASYGGDPSALVLYRYSLDSGSEHTRSR